MENRYAFYSKSDPSKEYIGKTKAESLEEAFEIFATQKSLSVSKFAEIYQINEL